MMGIFAVKGIRHMYFPENYWKSITTRRLILKIAADKT